MLKLHLIPPPPTPLRIIADGETFTLQARAMTIRDAHFISSISAEFARRETPDNHPARYIASVLPQFDIDGRRRIMLLAALPEMDGADAAAFCDAAENLADVLPAAALSEIAKILVILQELSMPEKEEESPQPAGKKLRAILLTVLPCVLCAFFAYHLTRYLI